MSSLKADRARRLLALLRHLEPDTEIELEELASLVGTTPDVVAQDIGTLSMCGVAPYDPLNLVSAFVDDGRVIVMGPPPALDRPVRLSQSEARALTAALQSAGFDAHDGLTKRLADVASIDFSAEELGRRLRATGSATASAVYESLATAIAENRVATIEYMRAGESSAEERAVEPSRLFNDRGTWYVFAHCRVAQDTRTFRVDRIRQANVTDEVFEPRTSPDASLAFADSELPRAQLRFRDASEYSQREWPGSTPVGSVAKDGSLLVAVGYSGTAWVARQVCARMGCVTVESPDEVRDAVAAVAARVTHEIG